MGRSLGQRPVHSSEAMPRRWGRPPVCLPMFLGLVGFVLLSTLSSAPARAGSCGGAGAGADAGASGERPRIGLALSGGGTRGLAHVGVLRVLEDLGVPIDCMAGTSMGAIVGGLYASGYSPDQIEQELLTMDWQRIFRGKPPRESLSVRRKQDDNRYVFDLELGFKNGKLTGSGGALSAFELEFQLQRLTLPALGVEDFDQLRVPFRAVAADLVTGETVVLGGGDLAMAIRASMSLPGVFPPVTLDGRRLVDGGAVTNLPVDVVRSMGADVVIAVDIGLPLFPLEELTSVASISAQALSLATDRLNGEQRARADLLIRPELAGVGLLDFSALDEVIREGAATARRHGEALAKLAVDGTTIPEGDPHPATVPVSISAIRIEGLERVDERLVSSRLRTRLGYPLDLDLLLADLGRIVQIGELETVRFTLEPVAAGSELVMRLAEKSWGPNYLRFGASLSDDLEGSNSFALLVSYTRTSLNARGAEWRNDFQLGETRRFFSELYQPLSFHGRFFVAGSFESLLDVTDLYEEQRKVAEYEVQSNVVNLSIGSQFGKYGELRAGLSWGKGGGEPRAGPIDLTDLDVTIAGLGGRLVIDRLDSSSVPRHGFAGQLSGFRSEPSLGADDAYHKIAGAFSSYATRGRHTAFLGLEGGTALDSELPIYDQFVLGGLFSFSGYRPQELRGQHVAIARQGYLYRAFDLPPSLGVAMYVGGWLEVGNVWQRRQDVDATDLTYSLTLAAALDTRLGPMYFGYGYAERGTGYFQLLVGPRF